jgi:hypothetical protein
VARCPVVAECGSNLRSRHLVQPPQALVRIAWQAAVIETASISTGLSPRLSGLRACVRVSTWRTADVVVPAAAAGRPAVCVHRFSGDVADLLVA